MINWISFHLGFSEKPSKVPFWPVVIAAFLLLFAMANSSAASPTQVKDLYYEPKHFDGDQITVDSCEREFCEIYRT